MGVPRGVRDVESLGLGGYRGYTILRQPNAEVDTAVIPPFLLKQLLHLQPEGIPVHGLERVLRRPRFVAFVQPACLHADQRVEDATRFEEVSQRILFLPVLPTCPENGGGDVPPFALPGPTTLE